jgi:hypothetical protein
MGLLAELARPPKFAAFPLKGEQVGVRLVTRVFLFRVRAAEASRPQRGGGSSGWVRSPEYPRFPGLF